MKGKRVFYCELAYALGIIVLALGTALMERADFGMSMVIAPAYIIHLKISQYLPFFSFGVSDYVFQAVLLLLLILTMRKFKISYLLSFATAFLYGNILDIAINLVQLFPYSSLVWQVIFYILGLIFSAIGVALLLHTYLPPEVYELIVKELSQKYNISIGKTKTIYDCCSCLLSLILSLCFFYSFVGIKWGTIICAVVNGRLIGLISRFIENKFIFKDIFPLRKKLE